MNAATASPRPGELVAATLAKAGLAAPMPTPSAPATASAMPIARIAWTRSRARTSTRITIPRPARNTGM